LTGASDPLFEELACLGQDVEDNKRSLEDIFEAMQDEFSPMVTLEVMHALVSTKMELSRQIQNQAVPEPIEESSEEAPPVTKLEPVPSLSMSSFSEQYSFLKGKIASKAASVFELTQHERNAIKPPNEDDIVMSEPLLTQDSLERPPPCIEEAEQEEETPKGKKRAKRAEADFSNIGLKPKRQKGRPRIKQ
jgi:hypothetical protein